MVTSTLSMGLHTPSYVQIASVLFAEFGPMNAQVLELNAFGVVWL